MRELPAGFKQIPSQPEFAINEKGFLINIETRIKIGIHTYGGKEPWVAFYKFDTDEGRNRKTEVLVRNLIEETFGMEETNGEAKQYRDISEYPAYQISRDGTEVLNTKTGNKVHIQYPSEEEPYVNLFKSGRDRDPYPVLISWILRETFPEDFDPDKCETPKSVDPRAKTITVNNAAIAREGLLQIKRDITENRHYIPGPLRMQTLRELLDHILTQIDGEDSFVWRRISGYPDYEVNSAGEIRNHWNGEMMNYLPHVSGFELRHITGEWTTVTLADILKLSN